MSIATPEVFQETCDGIDNDCDGVLDEMLTRSCTTACGDGMETVVTASGLVVVRLPPEIETCDNLDTMIATVNLRKRGHNRDLPAELSMCANPMGIQRCLEGAEWGRVKVWALTPKSAVMEETMTAMAL